MFSENRVIDGVELEGKEYLSSEESMLQIKYGKVFMKLENYSNAFKNSIKRSDFVYHNKTNPEQLLSGNLYSVSEDKLLKATSPTSYNLESSDRPGMSPLESRNEVQEFEKVKSKIFIGKLNSKGKMNQLHFRSLKFWVQQVDYNLKTVSSGTKIPRGSGGFGGLLEVIGGGLENYTQYKAGKDAQKMNIQLFEKKNDYNSVFFNAYLDILNAGDDGILNGFTLSEIDQIFNYVLYGGDKGQSIEVIETGKYIINNYSTNTAKFRLWSIEYEQKTLEIFSEPINTDK